MEYMEYKTIANKELENMNRNNIGRMVSPLAAIKRKCLDCSAGNVYEAQNCQCTGCAIYPFRFGRNPYGNELSEEELKNIRNCYEEYRAAEVHG